MNFLPREEKFFEYFRQQVQFLREAGALLLDGVTGVSEMTRAAEAIRKLEGNADGVIHEIYTRLNSTFITPLDPEDIHSLASHLDDVIDGIEDAAYRLVAYRIDPVPPPVVELCKIVKSCGEALERAFSALAQRKPLLEHCIEVNTLESRADQLVRAAVVELFDTEKDPIRVIKLKEIYDVLEQTTDFAEDVADALQNVHVKNS